MTTGALRKCADGVLSNLNTTGGSSTHASEHAENAADELLGENLGTACTANQIWKSDGTGGINCAADATAALGGGADVKGGSDTVTEDTCTSISFNTVFTATPVATGNVINGAEDNVVSITNLATTGFDLCLEKVGGGAASSYTVYWMATDGGNP